MQFDAGATEHTPLLNETPILDSNFSLPQNRSSNWGTSRYICEQESDHADLRHAWEHGVPVISRIIVLEGLVQGYDRHQPAVMP